MLAVKVKALYNSAGFGVYPWMIPDKRPPGEGVDGGGGRTRSGLRIRRNRHSLGFGFENMAGRHDMHRSCSRRRFLGAAGTLAGGLFLGQRIPVVGAEAADTDAVETIRRNVIPATGERIPAIGMGTYITFNVGPSERLRRNRLGVLQTFLDLGGGMIDSSPMYGSSEEVLGYCLERAEHTDRAFTASKVWTRSTDEGRGQIDASMRLWKVETFDLFQVHNLLNWEAHLRHLRRRKENGDIRYTGVTTSHGRRHRELESILRNEPIDFVQLTYNIENRETGETLIPLARERGIAIIANRPYAGGRLMERYKSRKLPPWGGEAGIHTWADFFLKFIIATPGITCAIPATSRTDHMKENMGALHGPLPDADARRRMREYLAGL